jgi:hypothetical protein
MSSSSLLRKSHIAHVTGIEACCRLLGRNVQRGVLPVAAAEPPVALGKTLVATRARTLLGAKGSGPFLIDVLRYYARKSLGSHRCTLRVNIYTQAIEIMI